VGFSKRADFYTTLQACLITRAEHLQVFSQIFNMFWRDPEFLENMMQTLLPMMDTVTKPKKPKAAERRAAEAMFDNTNPPKLENIPNEVTMDAKFSTSLNESLKNKDFEQMTNAEIRDAERAVAKLSLPIRKLKSRRSYISAHGQQIDVRSAFRTARRTGGEILYLPKKSPKLKTPNLVILTDISGSMSKYSRMMLHFVHSMSRLNGPDWANVHAFTFGTHLSNITKLLNFKDPDAALKAIGTNVDDWEGGTRIGQSLHAFNKDWSRRVLGTNTIVILITDGLERDDTNVLGFQMKRLNLSCRHVIWLNPLLRFDKFKPQAKGIRTMLPYVDTFLTCHNLTSLQELSSLFNDIEHHNNTRYFHS
jgi:uncharacterized protein with von Willebrand factor type A (vWA) domain